ncbi:hypothetical protein FT663_05131 [Candidozyma haemuli var. vulneris]|uniref:Uncharacterized protein n=1 Tax=Candidozyma haemuli TaxID=45357 RepID=A0A2V1AS81_9ASCO|nr:hypothetical protein CXQ85_002435 [[Candida] haemuloni]KAF3985836.1 hypothetical protein FT663_05131 [[Candida] haemuloni var. vulneris]KAF3990548.1 hypothetical protein FT662_02233 [[Candida] haemuloni var. vulneris]PVH20635.1 hypothetical protein CXQ85_002435 [[Candida] haemuloni]
MSETESKPEEVKEAIVAAETEAPEQSNVEKPREEHRIEEKKESPAGTEIAEEDSEVASEDTKAAMGEPKKRKSVGFAPEPEEDLEEHHQYLDDRRKDREKSNPFSKIPPELAYLESKPEGPKPLPTLQNVFEPKVKAKPFKDMRDRRCVAVKDISVVNKQTELNFNYWETPNPCSSDSVIVDIKYVSLASYDISKLNKYLVNLSNTKVGLGFDFVGTVIRPGSKLEGSEFTPGTTVFGVVNPEERKGSLSSALVVTPGRDILIAVHDEVLTKLEALNVNLSFDPTSFAIGTEAEDHDGSSSDLFSSNSDLPQVAANVAKRADPKNDSQLKADVPDLAKLSVFGSSYCRAKSALSVMDQVFARNASANVLINGGDTQLGYTILQMLFSSVYTDVLETLNVFLVVKESSLSKVKNLAERFSNGGSHKVHVISYDLVNEDLVLPGEKTPINYKKVPFFASEIVEKMFEALPPDASIDTSNINKCKLDLFIDIVGSKKMFQGSMSMGSLDEVNFPFKKKMAPGVQLTTLFGKSKGPLFEKLLKPKAEGCSFISFCKFNLPEPSYSISKLVDFTGADVFNPWASKWSQALANQFVAKYSYYEKFDLEVKKSWVEEGLRLLLKGELRFPIKEVSDWRNRFKQHVNELKHHDGQIVFEIENF